MSNAATNLPPPAAPKLPKAHIDINATANALPWVAKTIQTAGLDPKPLPGYSDMPGAWDETTRYKRVVERYPWGAIMFLVDRERKEAATLVIQGQLDLDGGKVRGGDGKSIAIPVKWYSEVAKTFPTSGRAVHLPVRIEVPGCLGYHQTDHVCDGGTNPSGQVEKPCGWRERCIPLQAHCASKALVPEELLKGKSPEWVVQATAKLLAAAQAAEAAPAPVKPVAKLATPAAAPAKQKPSPKPTPKPTPKPAPVAKEEAPEVDPNETFTALWAALQAAFPERAWHMGDGEGKPGEVFISDRRNLSGYLSVYVRPEEGHKVALMSFRFRRRMAGVQLPIPKGHDLLAEVDANTVSWKDGAFLSEVKPIPHAVSIESIVAILRGAVDSGVINLPAAKE